jgi:hypothetical protein
MVLQHETEPSQQREKEAKKKEELFTSVLGKTEPPVDPVFLFPCTAKKKKEKGKQRRIEV